MNDPTPELPPSEDLLEPIGPPPVSDLQTGLPEPYRGWEVRARYATPEAMCEAWGRANAPKGGGPVRPLAAKSQLADAKGIERWLEEPVAIVHPDADRQAASEVEATPGFVRAEPCLRDLYVRGLGLDGRGWRRVLVLHGRLRLRWPHGFDPDPDPLLRHRATVRADQARRVGEDVDRARRKGRPKAGPK